jgi:prepilin-type processing-associated H-X9-DG protein
MDADQDTHDKTNVEPEAYPIADEVKLAFYTLAGIAVFLVGVPMLSLDITWVLLLIGTLFVVVWITHTRIRPSRIMIAIAAFAVFPIVHLSTAETAHRPSGNRSICHDRIRQLGYALLFYNDAHKGLPPAAKLDKDGQPLHSWRTLILPFSDEPKLAKQIDLSEPWNSPHNQSALHKNLECFRCPSETNGKNEETSYVAIIGPGTAWQPGKGLKLRAIKDKPSETILLVEMKNSGIHWAEPRDLDLNALPAGITQANLLASLSNHTGGFNAFFADGSVQFIPMNTPWKTFMAMLTVSGGETIGRW